MPGLPLFPDAEADRPPLAARLGPRLRELAGRGVYLGTSSWKYPGWIGSIYSAGRYRARGRHSRARFEAGCLAEYAETFPVVGGDFSFYRFPAAADCDRLFGGVPGGLLFALKVPEELTVAVWPGHPRYGDRAGKVNESFLDPGSFRTAFARPLAAHRGRVAVLIFEFGAFTRGAMVAPSAFLERLDPFLAALPGGFRYAVEVRNPEFLGPDYFGVLRRNNVAHVLSAWSRMPELGEQAGMPGSETADFAVARALLRRGRPYEEAVRRFEPYREVREPEPGARGALVAVARRSMERGCPAFLLVNNRLEGFAPGTIESVAGAIDG